MGTPQGFEDCLKLLKGQRDEQRLAGLLLATKFCQGDDKSSILKVYDAVGPLFLSRLLRTGMMKGGDSDGGRGEEREAYLRLSVTLLASFCRVPEIAASGDMVANVPIVLEAINKTSDISISEECLEMLLLVATETEDGLIRLYESGVIPVLASHISCLSDGSQSMELAIRLLQRILSKLPLDLINVKHQSEMSSLVQVIAKQFGVLHSAIKFDALHLLTGILSLESSVALHDLQSKSNEMWASYIRVGIVTVLQNRVVSAEKLQALVLANSVMSLVGEIWLLGHSYLPGQKDQIPVDKCVLLVLESARVEAAVLLNELAYLKYEASKNSSFVGENITLKQRDLAVAFSVLERIIKLISSSEGEGNSLTENVIMKAISGLNETIGLVLDYLADAKEHGQKKGDDLIASIRLLGSYLAETPFACKEKVQDLLGYILSTESNEEKSPFYSTCFMLPMLCQATMDIEGCKMLLSVEGQKDVVDCLAKVIGHPGSVVEDNGTAFLACDTILNLLLNEGKLHFKYDDSLLFNMLLTLAIWAEKCSVPSVTMIVSSICALVFDHTSEEALLSIANFDRATLESLYRVIARSWDASEQVNSDSKVSGNHDLRQIVITGCSRWIDRFPQLRKAIESSASF